MCPPTTCTSLPRKTKSILVDGFDTVDFLWLLISRATALSNNRYTSSSGWILNCHAIIAKAVGTRICGVRKLLTHCTIPLRPYPPPYFSISSLSERSFIPMVYLPTVFHWKTERYLQEQRYILYNKKTVYARSIHCGLCD